MGKRLLRDSGRRRISLEPDGGAFASRDPSSVLSAIFAIFMSKNAIAFLIEGFSFDQALWHSLFHTCSSFNNAGFDILGSSSLIDYKSK